MVTGPPGAGKTTLADRLLNELNPSKTVSVRMVASDLASGDLLRKLAYAFGLPAEGMDVALLTHRLERYLIELEHSQRRALLLIDEAHKLSNDSLEGLRILTDLQSRSRPVLQLFLLGQEGLENVLQATGMEQFQQRVIASCRLQRMDLVETKSYMEYRLAKADWRGDPSINGPAVLQIFRYSQGLPRHVNKICSRLLLHGSSEEKHALEESDVRAVVQDMHHELLAPLSNVSGLLEGEADVSEEATAQLALVPPPQIAPPQPRVETSRAEMNSLFLTEEQAQRAERLEDERMAARAAGRRIRPDGHYHGRRSFAFRRAVFNAMQMPRKLLAWVVAFVREKLPVYANVIAAALTAAVGAVKARWGQLHTKVAKVTGNKPAAGMSLKSAPVAWAAAITGVVVVTALIVSKSGDTPSLATNGQDQGAALPDGLVLQSGDPAADSVLLHHKYVDAAAMQGGVLGSAEAGPLGATGLGLINGGSDASPWRLDAGHISLAEMHNERFDRLSGADGEVDNELAGKVANDIAGPLLGRVAEVTGSLDVWGLAKLQATVRKKADTAQADEAQQRAAATADAQQAVAPPAPEQVAADDTGANDEESDNIALVVSSEKNIAPGFVEFLPAPAAGNPGKRKAADVKQLALAGDTTVKDGAVVVDAPEVTADTSEPLANVQMASLEARDLAAPAATAVDTRMADPRVSQNLGLAKAAFDDDRLLIPESDSAFTYYGRVLEIDAGNAEALAGMQKIAQRYNALAWGAYRSGSFDRADLFVNRGLRVDPKNRDLLAMQARVGNAVTEREAAARARAEAQARAVRESERARRAAAAERERQRQQAEQQPKENAFQRLIRMVEGR